MKSFTSPAEMLHAHELMFGEAGRQCAEVVLKWATTLFAIPLDTPNIRVVLAPVELGPYNRHAGYCYGGKGKASLILGNRHVVKFNRGTLALRHRGGGVVEFYEDFIVHELTHIRQAQLLEQHAGEKGWKVSETRGAHRDRGWYTAIAEAAPNYLGVEVPEAVWPTGPRPRKGNNQLGEVVMTHWPEALRLLAEQDDPRLPKVVKAAQCTRVDVQSALAAAGE